MNENVSFPSSPRPQRTVNPASQPVTGRRRRSRPELTTWKALSTVLSVALVAATILTMWMPASLFSSSMLDRMLESVRPVGPAVNLPTPTNAPRPRIGLVAGHWGNDSGSVCDDGLMEMEVNLRIATIVQELLNKAGYDVELMKEFDPRLTAYKAMALVSIHNDSCQYINDEATGFKVAAAYSSAFPEKATRLTACLSQRYAAITGLPFHYNTVTRDMTEYHAFSEIHNETTAAIIETGFLNRDRQVLTEHTDLVAEGVASGILCFVRNEDIPQIPTVAP